MCVYILGTSFTVAISNINTPTIIIDRINIPTINPSETLLYIKEWLIGYKYLSNIKCIGIACFGPINLNKNSNTYGFITSTPKLLWRNTNIVGGNINIHIHTYLISNT